MVSGVSMINPPTVWEPRGLRPSPLPCDPLAAGAATSPLMPQRTSGSEGLTGSDLKSTSKAAKLAGEKQQIAAIASAKRTARPRKKDVTTAKPLSSLRAYRAMHQDTASPEHSLSPWNLNPLCRAVTTKSVTSPAELQLFEDE